jgi:hypothetical protein
MSLCWCYFSSEYFCFSYVFLLAFLLFYFYKPFYFNKPYRNPTLGLATKARVCKRSGQERDPGVWESVKMNTHTLKWTPMLGVGVPMDSRWTPESSKSDCKGQNPSPWRIHYIIGNLLKRRCLKWIRMTHLDICNTTYGQKKSWESNWQFDSWPQKVENRPDSLTCRWRATCRWKTLDEGYSFASDLIPIGGLHKKLSSHKVTGVPTLAISGLPHGSPRTKSHLDEGAAERCRVYYMGEGGGFPRIQVVMNLVNPKSPVALLSTKGAPTMH